MQASTDNEISKGNKMSFQLNSYCPIPNTIPYCLDKYQEDNLSISILQLYQVIKIKRTPSCQVTHIFLSKQRDFCQVKKAMKGE